MNISYYLRGALILGVVLSISGCGEGQKGEKVLARVNGAQLTDQEYRHQDFYYNYMSHLSLNNPDQRIQAMVESEVLYQEAKRQNLEDLPQVRRQIRQVLVNELLREQLSKLPHPNQISDQEALDYYNKNLDHFRSPETVHYAHILISLPDKDAALALANKILKDPTLQQPSGFNRLAAQYSTDKATAPMGGDLGFAVVPDNTPGTPPPATTWQSKLVKAAATIKAVGEIYPEVIETERGYHIVKLLAHEPSNVPTFEQARGQIMRQLAIERQTRAYRDFVDMLKAKDDISIDTNEIAVLTESGALALPASRPFPVQGFMPGMPPSGPGQVPHMAGPPLLPPPPLAPPPATAPAK